MSILLLALIPPILWAVINHQDKYLLSKSKHPSSVNVLMVYSTLFSFVVMPIVFYFAHDQLFASLEQILIQITGGLLLATAVYFYLMALNKDEASIVIPMSLLVPVFTYFFSYLLLGETLTSRQGLACLLIIVGTIILSLEFKEEEKRKLRIKYGVLFFMVLTTLFQAAQVTLFKFVTIENSFAVSIFWEHVGLAIYGIFLLTFRPKSWREFILSVKENGKVIFGVNILGEALNATAYIIRDYATLLAPLVIVTILNAYQPAFVFILGTILTIFIPRWVDEKIRPIHLLHKAAAIGIMIVGTVLIAQTL